MNDIARLDAFALFSRTPARALPNGIESELELRSRRDTLKERTWGERSADDALSIHRWLRAVKATLGETGR